MNSAPPKPPQEAPGQLRVTVAGTVLGGVTIVSIVGLSVWAIDILGVTGRKASVIYGAVNVIVALLFAGLALLLHRCGIRITKKS